MLIKNTMEISFTAHNIRLDDGSFTKPDSKQSMDAYPWFLSAKRVLETVFPDNRRKVRLADLGCLEGGYSVEFARMGFDVVGVEVRDNNFSACQYVKARTDLPNLEFFQDNAWNIGKYGTFDVVFCCGLLYHLDRPREFLETLSGVTRKLLILQTHFSIASSGFVPDFPMYFRLPIRPLSRLFKVGGGASKFTLSRLTVNESVQGRWYREYLTSAGLKKRENARWASWDNRRSFWIRREFLLQAIQDAGFDLVFEQFDSLGPNIAASMIDGYYKTDNRGTFVGIKTVLTS